MFRNRPSISAVLLAVACIAAGPAVAKKPPPPPQGGLVIGVSINSVRANWNFPMYYWGEIIEADPEIKKPKVISSGELLGEVGGTALYYFSAPAGKYKFNRLVANYQLGDMLYTEWLPFGDRFPEFTIEADRLLDGGTILVQPLGKRFLLNRVPSYAGQLDFARAALKGKMPAADAQPALVLEGWEDSARSLVALIERNAALTGPFLGTRDGRVLVPGKFGQLLRYEEGARWNARGTGIASDLFSVMEARDGDLIVGAEFGTIARAESLFSEWTIERLPAGAGAVQGIVETPDGGLVALTNYGAQRLSAWGLFWAAGGNSLPGPASFQLYKRGTDGSWSMLKEIALAKGTAPTAFATNNTLVMRIGKRKLGRWSAADGSWEEFEVPVDNIDVQVDGTWVGTTSGGVFSSVEGLYSRDAGKTWTELKRGSQRANNRVTFTGKPVALKAPGQWLVEGYNPSVGMRKSSGYYRSQDDGVNWKRDEPMAGVCGGADRIATIGESIWVVCSMTQVYGLDGAEGEWKAQREFVAPAQ